MSTGRHREFSIPVPGGTCVRFDGSIDSNPSLVTVHRGYCDDIIGNYGQENSLSMWKSETIFGYINGKQTRNGNPNYYTFNNWIPSVALSTTGSGTLPSTSGFLSTTAGIANSNPGKPDVELPVFLFELKDVPDMLKHAYKRGKLLEKAANGGSRKAIGKYMSNPKNPAEDWLNYNFGWRPFMEDALAIAGLSEGISKRMARFRAWDQGHISSRAMLGKNSISTRSTTTYDPIIGNIADVQQTVSIEKWLVGHWKFLDMPTYNALINDRDKQIRMALGLDIGIHHVWNAMPWTWLTDWFVDIGSLIEARANRFGLRYDNGSVMTHTKTEIVYTPRYRQGDPTCSTVWKTYESKGRGKAVPSTEYRSSLNFLTGGQLATLASLAVTKGKGGSTFNT